MTSEISPKQMLTILKWVLGIVLLGGGAIFVVMKSPDLRRTLYYNLTSAGQQEALLIEVRQDIKELKTNLGIKRSPQASEKLAVIETKIAEIIALDEEQNVPSEVAIALAGKVKDVYQTAKIFISELSTNTSSSSTSSSETCP